MQKKQYKKCTASESLTEGEKIWYNYGREIIIKEL